MKKISIVSITAHIITKLKKNNFVKFFICLLRKKETWASGAHGKKK